MLEEGDDAPGFRCPGTEGEVIEPYDLAEFTRRGVAVLVFYPFDFSPVCTTELCEFRDAEFLTFTEGVDVAGLSGDSASAHRRFVEANDLPFPLLSDSDGAVSRAYDVRYDEWEQHPGVPKRAVYVVDSDRTVRYAWDTEDAYENPDLYTIYETLKTIDELDFDGAVTPAGESD
jgi:peroxiredoxin